MRAVYILRHGEPKFDDNKRRCIGVTDYSISALGKIQACLLSVYFREIQLSDVYCSNLKRAIETAGFICDKPVVLPCLREIDMGEWENAGFEKIKQNYSKLYEQRGGNPFKHTPPGGESFTDAQNRIINCFNEIVGNSGGNIAIVAHAGVNRLLLCKSLDVHDNKIFEIHQPYGCINVLSLHERNADVIKTGLAPMPLLDYDVCILLLESVGAPPKLISHCKAVAGTAQIIAKRVADNGFIVDEKAVLNAALLHDIAKGHENHAETGANWLRSCGYGIIGDIIASHMDCAHESSLESKIVFIADKLVLGDKQVSLDERFAVSKAKCVTEKSMEVWKSRFENAKSLFEKLRENEMRGLDFSIKDLSNINLNYIFGDASPNPAIRHRKRSTNYLTVPYRGVK